MFIMTVYSDSNPSLLDSKNNTIKLNKVIHGFVLHCVISVKKQYTILGNWIQQYIKKQYITTKWASSQACKAGSTLRNQ